MGLYAEDRLSDSPYVETVTRGQSEGNGSTIRPAESHWHMVFVRHSGGAQSLVVGPLTTSGIASWKGSAEILWIKFKLGVFMPHLPTRDFLNVETPLPTGTSHTFWLKSSTWQFPDYENADTFVERLVRDDLLVRDPVVDTVLQGHLPALAPRTVRHRFLQTTGLTQTHIYQIERAQRAARLLEQGIPILDAVEEVGYFDQPHLTRALKRWVGYTPAQIIRKSQPEPCHFVQDPALPSDYDGTVLTKVH